MSEDKFRIVDLFCGIGCIRLGFEKAGAVTVWSCEWDKYKRKGYESIFGHEPDADDIRAVDARDIPDADCWCFGSPCTSFSQAGRREGLDGASGLIKEVFRLLWDKEPSDRPKWLLYENVKGMLSSNRGWDFAFILAEMDKLGFDCEWFLLNSKDFGVPQNRERVYVVGRSRYRSGRSEVFPFGKDTFSTEVA